MSALKALHHAQLTPHRTLVAVVLSLALLAGLSACRQTATTNAPPAGKAPTAGATIELATPQPFKVRSNIGFATRQKYLDHFDKHGHEFGNITAEEYLQLAQTLRDRPAGGEVLESVRASDGVVTRFDNTSGAFLAFNQDLTIRTYFKPNDGARYFWRQSRR